MDPYDPWFMTTPAPKIIYVRESKPPVSFQDNIQNHILCALFVLIIFVICVRLLCLELKWRKNVARQLKELRENRDLPDV